MTASFMRCCASKIQMTDNRMRGTGYSGQNSGGRRGSLRIPHSVSRILRLVFCVLLSAFCFLSSAFGEGIGVRRAEARFTDGGYQISADFNINFRFVVEQALEQGVPLYFVSEFTLTHPRWYWLDDVVEQNEQTFKLSYNTLARQYRITRGALYQNFSNLEDALRIIGHLSVPAIPAEQLQDGGNYISEKLFKKDDNYVAAVRLRLDVSQLPKPLQVNALAGDDWSLDSGWYRWIVRPATNARNGGE